MDQMSFSNVKCVAHSDKPTKNYEQLWSSFATLDVFFGRFLSDDCILQTDSLQKDTKQHTDQTKRRFGEQSAAFLS